MIHDTETLKQILQDAGCTEQDVLRILALQEAGRNEDVLCQLRKRRCVCMQQLHEQQRQVDRLDRLIREQAAI